MRENTRFVSLVTIASVFSVRLPIEAAARLDVEKIKLKQQFLCRDLQELEENFPFSLLFVVLTEKLRFC